MKLFRQKFLQSFISRSSFIKNIRQLMLKLTSHDILHCLVSADLSKNIFSIDCVNIFIFSHYFFQDIFPGGNVWGYIHCLYRHSLTLMKTLIFGIMGTKSRELSNLRVF